MIAIGGDSDVDRVQVKAQNHPESFLLSIGHPLVGDFQGPLKLSPVPSLNTVDNGTSDPFLHKLDVRFYNYVPQLLPRERAPKDYAQQTTVTSAAAESTIRTVPFFGRQGGAWDLENLDGTDSILWRLTAINIEGGVVMEDQIYPTSGNNTLLAGATDGYPFPEGMEAQFLRLYATPGANTPSLKDRLTVRD